ncbi:MAG TPA: IclR family transcriptional regulator [Homoserinimonas sp.]|nr:IclR family transcriptional regulator [Homoserinimonas sp.]
MSTEAPHSQTLSRGIRVLEILAEATGPMTIADVAAALGVHRSIAYRILRTLEDHGLVARDGSGALSLGPKMAALARGVSRDLQAAALPELTTLANELGMTAFVTVLDHQEVVTLVSVEPRHAHATVAQRPGTKHPLAVGAPGITIQSVLSAAQWRTVSPDAPKRPEAADAAVRGYATSHDEVIAGLKSVAVPLMLDGHPPASVAVVYVATEFPVERIAERLATAATAIAREL